MLVVLQGELEIEITSGLHEDSTPVAPLALEEQFKKRAIAEVGRKEARRSTQKALEAEPLQLRQLGLQAFIQAWDDDFNLTDSVLDRIACLFFVTLITTVTILPAFFRRSPSSQRATRTARFLLRLMLTCSALPVASSYACIDASPNVVQSRAQLVGSSISSCREAAGSKACWHPDVRAHCPKSCGMCGQAQTAMRRLVSPKGDSSWLSVSPPPPSPSPPPSPVSPVPARPPPPVPPSSPPAPNFPPATPGWGVNTAGRRVYPPRRPLALGREPTSFRPPNCSSAESVGCIIMPRAAILNVDQPKRLLSPDCLLSSAVGCLRLPASTANPDEPTGAPVHADGEVTYRIAPSSSLPGSSTNTRAMEIGDLNSDGFLDVVIGNLGQADELLFGDGTGGFSRTTFSSVWNTLAVALGDVNEDGHLDIIVAGANNRELLLGDGSGTFVSSSGLSDDVDGRPSLAVGDMNNDGHLDIVSGQWDAPPEVLLGDGSGGFSRSDTVPIRSRTSGTRSVALGDFNNDGYLDVVIVKYHHWVPDELLLSDGAGQFNTITFPLVEHDSHHVVVADVNQDGALDIVFAYGWGTGNKLLLGDGTGNFTTSAIFPGSHSTTTSLALADVNRDGFLDIVQGIESSDDVDHSILLGDGTGHFTHTQYASSSRDTACVAVGDMNNDGFLDILVGRDSGRANTLQLVTAAPGTFSRSALIDSTVVEQGHIPTAALAVGDVNRDGNLDIIVAYMGEPNQLLLGDGEGGLSKSSIFPGGGNARSRSLAIGDINGDGLLDVVMGNDDYESVQGNQLLIGDGFGGFIISSLPGFTGVRTVSTALGDLDHDGHLDIVFGNYESRNFLLLNDGNGGFRRQSLPDVPTRKSWSTALGDVNQDGHLDIIFGNGWWHDNGQPNELHLGDGSGGFVLHSTFPGRSAQTKTVALADVNRDGKLDLVVGNSNAENELLIGDGTGGFSSIMLPGGSQNTAFISLGDVNGDGHVDIVVANEGDANTLLLGDGNSGFTVSPAFPPGSSSSVSVALGDMNNDGAFDLIIGNTFGGNELLTLIRCPDAGTARSSTGFGCIRCPSPMSRRSERGDNHCY